MKKAQLFAVALVALFAAVAPALAQEAAGGADCGRVQAAAAARSVPGSEGKATAGEAAAIARALGVDRELVDVCLETGVPLEDASGNTASAAPGINDALPETGGASPAGLGASLMGLCVLLLAGGRLLRRTAR